MEQSCGQAVCGSACLSKSEILKEKGPHRPPQAWAPPLLPKPGSSNMSGIPGVGKEIAKREGHVPVTQEPGGRKRRGTAPVRRRAIWERPGGVSRSAAACAEMGNGQEVRPSLALTGRLTHQTVRALPPRSPWPPGCFPPRLPSLTLFTFLPGSQLQAKEVDY